MARPSRLKAVWAKGHKKGALARLLSRSELRTITLRQKDLKEKALGSFLLPTLVDHRIELRNDELAAAFRND